MVGSFNEELIDFEYAVRFPEDQIERLIYLGFERNGKYDYKSQAITMLMNYGGLRKSEIFHIFTSDITLNPNRPKEALVRVYHPELGTSPDPQFKTDVNFFYPKHHSNLEIITYLPNVYMQGGKAHYLLLNKAI